jgi:caffeoyl-CoA O-methyltransferase
MDTSATTPPDVDDYCSRHSTRAEPVLEQIEKATYAQTDAPQMLSGHVVGGLLASLAHAGQARRALDVGTFTGYSALTIAAAMPEDGVVISLELDPDRARMARAMLDDHPAGKRIEIRVGPALECIEQLAGPFDLVFLDAAKYEYSRYLDALLPKLATHGVIVADNTLWSGAVLGTTSGDADTDGLRAFNARVASDPSLRAVLLPVRDGVTLITRATRA